MADPANKDNAVAVVVLAGGHGRRIGGGKPLRLLGGEPLVDRALARAQRLSDHVALSVGGAGQLPDCGVEAIVDPQPDWGALGGLAASLDFAERNGLDRVLTLPCDCPFLPDDLLVRLGAALQRDGLAAIPRSDGRMHVACGLWRTSARAVVAEYAGGGGRSLHGLVERLSFAQVEWPTKPIDPFFNINSPEELETAERLLASHPTSA
jgi:molybdenum cofactor guanylyltransferase